VNKPSALITLLLTVASGLSACSGGNGNSDNNGGGQSPGTMNNAPVAHAGSDTQILVDHKVRLDGSLSSDIDGDDLSYSWTMVSRPNGSTATLSDGRSVQPLFTPDQVGSYQFELVVHDGQVSSSGAPASAPAAASAASTESADTAQADHLVTLTAVPAGGPCCLENQFQINTAACANASTLAWQNISNCPADDSGVINIAKGEHCQYTYVDESNKGFALGRVNIGAGGRLVFLDKGQNLSAERIQISGGSDSGDVLPAGQLVIGSQHCPIVGTSSQLTLEFKGTRPADGSANILDEKGIFLGNKGEMLLHGGKGVVTTDPVDSNGSLSWTYLTVPAGPATYSSTNGIAAPVPSTAPDTTLTLARTVDWSAGDWIAVTGTGFASDQTEFVQIHSIDNGSGVSVISLIPGTPLLHYHYGSLAPSAGKVAAGTLSCNNVTPEGDAKIVGLPASFCDGPDRNYGVDERAVIALVSRSIKLTSDAPDTGSSAHFGGQIKILPGYSIAEIQGVEIEKFGQDVTNAASGVTDIKLMSAYPIHFHMVGDVSADTLINSNTIHHSYNKCVTVHMSNNALIQHNVCARAVGHSFYLEEGNELGNTFKYNLAAGAMATEFTPSIDASKFWTGDYLAAGIHYDGIDVATTTNGTTPVAVPSGSSNFVNLNKVEASNPTGFWISSPGNTFDNNLVAGCQLQGRGFWVLPETADVLHTPITSFENNRVHSCYNGLDTAADLGSIGQNYTPYLHGQNVLAVFDTVTATRNRNRGIWLRPNWYHVSNARLATNRDSVSLVSAGGSEGSPPGEWSLLTDSVIVGVSNNNPERFGPCPRNVADGSCYGMQAKGGNAIPSPAWNFAGFMFYDGPARLENNRFVNFLVDPAPLLTTSDTTFMKGYLSNAPGQTLPPYEGDAAMGWFQSNVNNYPPTQYSLASIFENVDLRHQVYTEEVNLSLFVDGDKNTVILDRDGTLSGYKVVDDHGVDVPGKFPISLNNLAFNGSPYSVDECLSTGAQDKKIENRATALMSPQSYATLELTAWNPTFAITGPDALEHLKKKAPITFIKDAQDYIGSTSRYAPADSHYSMTLVGRNNTQVREPKVMSGMGYTLHSTQQCTEVGAQTVNGVGVPLIAPPAAFPRYVSMGFTDATSSTELDKDGNWKRPVRVRVGLCYKTEKGPDVSTIDPADFFSVQKGRKSYGGPTGPTDPNWKQVPGCNNFAFTVASNFDTAGGTDPEKIQSGCPGTLDATNDPVKTLSQAPTWEDFTAATNDDDYYWWDGEKGMLFLYLEQKEPNLSGGTPLATCGPSGTGGAACDLANDFYPCPEAGCVLYTVRAVDGGQSPIGYAPTLVGNDYGATSCDDVYSATKGRNYTQTYPPNDTVSWTPHKLARMDGTVLDSAAITPAPDNEGTFFCTTTSTPPAPACTPPAANATCNNNFPHNLPVVAASCAVNAPSPPAGG
jgi:K319-like protein/G8 domain-containing protein